LLRYSDTAIRDPTLSFTHDDGPAVIVTQRFSEFGIRWVGLLITAVAVGFIAWSLYTSDLLATDAWMNPPVIVGVVLAALLFTLSLSCVYTAWYLIVLSISAVKISLLEAFYIYSVSQIYKYVPSNIMHQVGRYYMLRRRGVEHSAAGWGMLAETALMITASIFERDVSQLMHLCRQVLGIRAPRDILVVDRIPRNAAGKPLRRELTTA
jgi:hypothetical protein